MTNGKLEDHIEFLLSAAIQKCGNLADAQDLAQETMLAAYVFLEKGGVIDNPKSWLSAVLNRKYYDMLRRKYQLPTVVVEEGFDIAGDDDISDNLIKEEEAENLRRELAYLADTYRTVITKHYFQGKSVKEIAAELGIAEGTVKSRLDFGRKQIKKGFETMEKREKFSSRLGFILISAGCAIGLGNVWRFPYITGQYGGAAFDLIYLLRL